jgi:acetyl esterase/lipase
MPDVPPPARTVAYGIDPAQVYDVRIPRSTPTGTTVVVVHGGFWKAKWDREHVAAPAQAFADAGHHVAVIEYRRTGMRGGGWPGTFADVSAAVGAIVGDPSLPDRCVLVGHSAGGHLVALVATQPEARSLAGVIALAGCVDLALVRVLGLSDGAAARFMGDADDAAWFAADPAAHPALAPVLLIHGESDDDVPVEVAERYLDRQGPSAHHDLIRLPGVGHDELIDPAHPAFAVVLDAVARLAAR